MALRRHELFLAQPALVVSVPGMTWIRTSQPSPPGLTPPASSGAALPTAPAASQYSCPQVERVSPLGDWLLCSPQSSLSSGERLLQQRA